MVASIARTISSGLTADAMRFISSIRSFSFRWRPAVSIITRSFYSFMRILDNIELNNLGHSTKQPRERVFIGTRWMDRKGEDVRVAMLWEEHSVEREAGGVARD